MEGAEIHAKDLLDDVCPVCGHSHDHEEHEHHHPHDHKGSEPHHHHDHEGHEHHHDHHDHDHHHHHHADDVFSSWGLETSKKFTEDQIREILNQMPETVLRAKGMVLPRMEHGFI